MVAVAIMSSNGAGGPTALNSIVQYVLQIANSVGPAEERKEAAVQSSHVRRRQLLAKMDLRLTDGEREALIQGTLDPTRAVRAVRKWVPTSIPMLILCGSVGTGKTVAIAEAGLCLGGGLCLSPSRLYRETKREDSTAAIKSHFVALDDLGVEHLNGQWMEAFQDWLDMRRVLGRTLLTTNLNPRALQIRYGDRVWDRLRSDGVFVELSGTSMRKNAV
jgi:DNA replication protein DnaC